MSVTLTHPWLLWDLGGIHDCLSFAPYRSGFVTAHHIAWREVRNADLPIDFDVIGWLDGEVATHLPRPQDSIAMLTSRDIHFHHHHRAEIGDTVAEALVTLGLSNAERIGTRRLAAPEAYGTINIAARLNRHLTQSAMLEAMTIIAEARTTAVLESGYQVMVDGKAMTATGTGTDCITLACTADADRPETFAGLHTEIGHALGLAVYEAVRAGCDTYLNGEDTK